MSPPSTSQGPPEAAASGSISRQNASSLIAAVARGADGPERRLALGEQVAGRRDRADLAEDVEQVLAVGVVRMGAEEAFVRVLGLAAAVARRRPASVSSMRSLSSMNRTKTQASTQATATCSR